MQKKTALQFSFAFFKSAEDSSWKQRKKLENFFEFLKKIGWDSMLQYIFILVVAYDESVYMHNIYILF